MKKIIWFKGAKTGGSSLREIFCKQVYNISYESVLKKGVTMEDYDITNKESTSNVLPGIFSAPSSIELYTEIFDQEDSLEQLEKF